MATADRVFMVVSFIQWRGWQRLKSVAPYQARVQLPIYGQIIQLVLISTSDYERR
jgi:hypothetical protein